MQASQQQTDYSLGRASALPLYLLAVVAGLLIAFVWVFAH